MEVIICLPQIRLQINLRAAESLADHDYFKETFFNANVLNINRQKHININKIIETKYSNSEPSLGGNLNYISRNKYNKVSYASRAREYLFHFIMESIVR